MDYEEYFDDYYEEIPNTAYDSNDCVGFTSIFEDVEYDPHNQTGADWYAMMLSASNGGRVIHGITIAPTMETLAKTDHEFAEKHAVGVIRYTDDHVYTGMEADEWDERLPLRPVFKTSRTATDTSILYDANQWEPAGRTRAKNAAILAATFNANGCDVDESLEIASAIACSEVPEEVLDNVIIPLSTLKREAVGVSKANHSIYSRCNAQGFITWEDQNLNQDLIPSVAACDWGRLNVIARYIAEANIRCDENYRRYAKEIGVPYALVTGAWAYVSSSDYVLDRNLVKAIPKVDIKKLGIPTFEDSFKGHRDDVHAVVMRAINSMERSEDEPNIAEFVKIAEGLRVKRKVKTIQPPTDILAGTFSHSLTAETAALAVSKTATAAKCSKTAAAELIKLDKTLYAKAEKVVNAVRENVKPGDDLISVNRFVCEPTVWIKAANDLGDMLANKSTGRIRVGKFKRSVTGTSCALEDRVGLTSDVKALMEPFIVAVCKEAVLGAPPKPIPKINLANYTSLDVRSSKRNILYNARDHMSKLKTQWAERYQARAESYSRDPRFKDKSVFYGAAASAFRDLNMTSLLSPSTQFLDLARINKSYLWESADSFARKRHFKRPPKVVKGIKGMAHLAEYLDDMYTPAIPFSEIEEFVRERIKDFAADLSITLDPEDIQNVLPEMEELPALKEYKVPDLITKSIKRSKTTAVSLSDVYSSDAESIKDEVVSIVETKVHLEDDVTDDIVSIPPAEPDIHLAKAEITHVEDIAPVEIIEPAADVIEPDQVDVVEPAAEVTVEPEPEDTKSAEPDVPPGTPQAVIDAMKEQGMSYLVAMYMYGMPEPEPRVTNAKVRATYPEGYDPDMFAIANGYKDFNAAYDDIDERARFDDETEYTHKGMLYRAKMLKKEEADADDSVLA